MTKKIEEILNLPSVDDIEQEESTNSLPQSDFDIGTMSTILDNADKIDSALPMVRDLDNLDADMDKYADKAMHAFADLMDLGQNVEDRHAANGFAVASTMMGNAITAKTAKMDKKLKMVQLQLQKAKLDHTVQVQATKGAKDDGMMQGEAEEFEDRNSLINAVLDKMGTQSSNKDK